MQPTAGHSMHTYEIRPRKDGRGFDLISDALLIGRLWQRARIVFDCRMLNDPAGTHRRFLKRREDRRG